MGKKKIWVGVLADRLEKMGIREEKNGKNGAPASVLLGVWVMLLEGRANREGKKMEKKKGADHLGMEREKN